MLRNGEENSVRTVGQSEVYRPGNGVARAVSVGATRFAKVLVWQNHQA